MPSGYGSSVGRPRRAATTSTSKCGLQTALIGLVNHHFFIALVVRPILCSQVTLLGCGMCCIYILALWDSRQSKSAQTVTPEAKDPGAHVCTYAVRRN
jgi:hypothetical protein